MELSRLHPRYKDTFSAAGYADIVVNDSYIGGHVRQYGNLSFSRIFDAGHMVSYYQPETMFTAFTRIIQGDDIGMGRTVDLSSFGTRGPSNSIHSNKVPAEPPSNCWLREIESTCTEAQKYSMYLGQGTVKDGIWFPPEINNVPKSISRRLTSMKATRSTTSRLIQPTGVYTATTTPTAILTSEASSHYLQFKFTRRQEPYASSSGSTGSFDPSTKRKVRKILIGVLSGVGALLL